MPAHSTAIAIVFADPLHDLEKEAIGSNPCPERFYRDLVGGPEGRDTLQESLGNAGWLAARRSRELTAISVIEQAPYLRGIVGTGVRVGRVRREPGGCIQVGFVHSNIAQRRRNP